MAYAVLGSGVGMGGVGPGRVAPLHWRRLKRAPAVGFAQGTLVGDPMSAAIEAVALVLFLCCTVVVVRVAWDVSVQYGRVSLGRCIGGWLRRC